MRIRVRDRIPGRRLPSRMAGPGSLASGTDGAALQAFLVVDRPEDGPDQPSGDDVAADQDGFPLHGFNGTASRPGRPSGRLPIWPSSGRSP